MRGGPGVESLPTRIGAREQHLRPMPNRGPARTVSGGTISTRAMASTGRVALPPAVIVEHASKLFEAVRNHDLALRRSLTPSPDSAALAFFRCYISLMSRISVGILRGGTSNEYNLSLMTGAAMLAVLPEEQYQAHDILIDKTGCGTCAECPQCLRGCSRR